MFYSQALFDGSRFVMYMLLLKDVLNALVIQLVLCVVCAAVLQLQCAQSAQCVVQRRETQVFDEMSVKAKKSAKKKTKH